MTFHVGQRVVCVDDRSHGKYNTTPVIYTPLNIVAGEIYTVEKVGVHYQGHDVVWLVGVHRDSIHNVFYDNVPLAAARFIPLQESGMSILRSIAANPKQKVDA